MKVRPRPAPPKIAQINRQEAIANIKRKLNILTGWASAGIPHAQTIPTNALEHFPKSIRQFNAWDGSQNSPGLAATLPRIQRNANDTLRKHPDLHEQVSQTISALRLRAAEQANAERPARLARLKAALRTEVQLRAILEAEIVALRREFKAEQKEHRKTALRAESKVSEFVAHVQNLTKANDDLREENRALTKRLAKVTPLRAT